MSSPAAHTPSKFFEAAWQAFLRAERASGESVNQHLEIGRLPVKLRFAGQALVPRIVPALEHLAADPGPEPSLTVCLFDSQSTGTPMPAPPWNHDAYGPRGVIQGFNTDKIHTIYGPGTSVLQMLDRDRRMAIYWVPQPDAVPYWESSFPLRPVLHWWVRDLPLQPIHAGAVGRPDGGVLIAGRSGSGKSTSTLACLHSDLRYAGDDYVLVRVDPEPFVFSLYNTAKLEPHNLARFPKLMPMVNNHDRLDGEKAMIFLHEHAPGEIVRGFPLRAILLPRVTGRRDTRLEPATPAAAVMALAPTTLVHLQGASQEAFGKLARLARKLPIYTLEAGTDLPQIPALILDLLKKGGL